MFAESKIWMMALFFLASFIWKAIKKKRKAEKEARESGENVEPKTASWGINDLINQFEEQYGGKQQEKVNVVDNPYENEPVDYYESNEGDVEQVNEYIADTPKNVTDPNYSEEEASHSAFAYASNTQEKKVKERDSYSEKLEEEAYEVDLKQMIIHNAILERPQY